ncbi:hypothetical protein AV521_00530 [Streptomyces sp. IMTB 2501]|uniref:hypothetical protein n=1 Tax=Streptomyces sp. IMTB 2501 TaxID=1776340 RepID=UPI00096BF5BD|nr:hypothetical protein [Streptomyces sp. IMTB 2501]OLZ74218.1 hypothetical protein AV521_00530 [Streptomyces sp. IMTB 2501]
MSVTVDVPALRFFQVVGTVDEKMEADLVLYMTPLTEEERKTFEEGVEDDEEVKLSGERVEIGRFAGQLYVGIETEIDAETAKGRVTLFADVNRSDGGHDLYGKFDLEGESFGSINTCDIRIAKLNI